MVQNNQFLVDWLKFTVPIPVSPRNLYFLSDRGSTIQKVIPNCDVIDRLMDIMDVMNLNFDYSKLNDLVQLHGFNGYNRMLEYKNIRFQWVSFDSDIDDKLLSDDDDKSHSMAEKRVIKDNNAFSDVVTVKRNCAMGVNVEISGSALRFYERYLSQFGISFFKILFRLSCRYPDARFTRIDLNLNLFNRKKYHVGLTPKAFYLANKNARVRSSSHTYHYQDSGDNREGIPMGDSCYLGTRRSDFYLRVYDKAKERKYSHGDFIDPNEFWIRWELELKGNLSNSVVRDCVQSGHDMYEFYLKFMNLLYTRIRVEPTDNQIKRGYYEVEKIARFSNGKKTFRKLKYAKFWYDFIQPESREKLRYSLPDDDSKEGLQLTQNHSTGSLYDEMAIHILKGGNGLKLLLHWLLQGKLKKSGSSYKAHLQQLEDANYNPDYIDDLYTDDEVAELLNSREFISDESNEDDWDKVKKYADEIFKNNHGLV